MLDKVLIVDDERIVRKGLRALVPWDEYGMEVVAEAPNGQKGWEAFLVHMPQIVITDIVMPEMDGLSLAKRIKAHAPYTRILLLSCHQDFTYAQQGIQIGVSGYVLKTVWDEEELKGYLQQFRRELDEAAKKDLLRAAHDEPNPSVAFFKWLEEQSEPPPAEVHAMFDRIWQGHGATVYACMGFVPQTAEDKRLPLLAPSLTELSFGGKERSYFVVAEARKPTVEAELFSWRLANPSARWEWSGPIACSADVAATFRKLHKKAELMSQFDLHPTARHDPIDKAVSWVLRNLSEPVTAVEVAERVGLSRSHFCTLFKKTVGENFGEFLDRRRAKLACELLTATTLPVHDICAKVGMTDAKYFSKWFKKATGCTPREFRRNHAEQNDDIHQTK
ncbi:response regulator [Brevibacillus fluminis]|uniref:Response regulator n=1 Tax=Brevibacillus fluminis TaxID=511487 RepID=A0A3M8D2P6_9BACL|nr:response regulator [Brevibacillus fluminis]RNB82354.1 response regulator [Brevibacillus fluminis]